MTQTGYLRPEVPRDIIVQLAHGVAAATAFGDPMEPDSPTLWVPTVAGRWMSPGGERVGYTDHSMALGIARKVKQEAQARLDDWMKRPHAPA